MEQSEYDVEQALASFLAAQLDHSGINRSKKLGRLDDICQKYDDLLAKSVGVYPMEDYQNIRQEREIMFYEYGFLEGMKFFQSIMIRSPEEMGEVLYPDEDEKSKCIFSVQEGRVILRERAIK